MYVLIVFGRQRRKSKFISEISQEIKTVAFKWAEIYPFVVVALVMVEVVSPTPADIQHLRALCTEAEANWIG